MHKSYIILRVEINHVSLLIHSNVFFFLKIKVRVWCHCWRGMQITEYSLFKEKFSTASSLQQNIPPCDLWTWDHECGSPSKNTWSKGSLASEARFLLGLGIYMEHCLGLCTPVGLGSKIGWGGLPERPIAFRVQELSNIQENRGLAW